MHSTCSLLWPVDNMSFEYHDQYFILIVCNLSNHPGTNFKYGLCCFALPTPYLILVVLLSHSSYVSLQCYHRRVDMPHGKD